MPLRFHSFDNSISSFDEKGADGTSERRKELEREVQEEKDTMKRLPLLGEHEKSKGGNGRENSAAKIWRKSHQQYVD